MLVLLHCRRSYLLIHTKSRIERHFTGLNQNQCCLSKLARARKPNVVYVCPKLQILPHLHSFSILETSYGSWWWSASSRQCMMIRFYVFYLPTTSAMQQQQLPEFDHQLETWDHQNLTQNNPPRLILSQPHGIQIPKLLLRHHYLLSL